MESVFLKRKMSHSNILMWNSRFHIHRDSPSLPCFILYVSNASYLIHNNNLLLPSSPPPILQLVLQQIMFDTARMTSFHCCHRNLISLRCLTSVRHLTTFLVCLSNAMAIYKQLPGGEPDRRPDYTVTQSFCQPTYLILEGILGLRYHFHTRVVSRNNF